MFSVTLTASLLLLSYHLLQTKKRKKHDRNQFIDDEAELSGSDVDQFSSEEMDGEEQEENSFIDDATQQTQATPLVARRGPTDMQAIYCQSLFSPLYGALNFHTPAFHKQKNRYKMVFNHRRRKTRDKSESESASEAEETFARESDLENEMYEAEEYESKTPDRRRYVQCDLEAVCQNPPSEERSCEASQIQRPIKTLKRKRILDDSVSEEELCPNEVEKTDSMTPKTVLHNLKQDKPTSTTNYRAYQNFPVRTAQSSDSMSRDFVKSSAVIKSTGGFSLGSACNDTSGISRGIVAQERQARDRSFFLEPNPTDPTDSSASERGRRPSLNTSGIVTADLCDDMSDAELLCAVDLTEFDNPGTNGNENKRLV